MELQADGETSDGWTVGRTDGQAGRQAGRILIRQLAWGP
jgi:hypothetical protein